MRRYRCLSRSLLAWVMLPCLYARVVHSHSVHVCHSDKQPKHCMARSSSGQLQPCTLDLSGLWLCASLQPLCTTSPHVMTP